MRYFICAEIAGKEHLFPADTDDCVLCGIHWETKHHSIYDGHLELLIPLITHRGIACNPKALTEEGLAILEVMES